MRAIPGSSLLLRQISRAAEILLIGALGTASGFCGPAAARDGPGLGNLLTTKDGTQIYGFDIDQNGHDGLLASAGYRGNDFVVSVETFDADTGKITKSFARHNSARNSYLVDGIFSGDVGLVTHYITPKGHIYARRVYEVMKPVTAKRFTGPWSPPLKDVDIQLAAENQATSTSVVFAIELKKRDRPVLIVSDVGANTFGDVIRLDPGIFDLADAPQLGQYTAANEAVIALSPDGGAVGGQAPRNFLIDLSTGKRTSFAGYNNGGFGAGYVNGLATDPDTGVSATDTELNAQVEFYDMSRRAGIAAVQLPCTTDTDQTYSGSGIAVDSVNKLFLVTEAYDACNNGSDSAIVVFDESGNYVETIPGFKFSIGEPPPALDPAKRMGWAFAGPAGFSQLQQFYY